jgi:hypothetical protein
MTHGFDSRAPQKLAPLPADAIDTHCMLIAAYDAYSFDLNAQPNAVSRKNN